MDDAKLKNKIIAAFLVFLAFVILYSLFLGPAKKWSSSFVPARSITVSAEGKVVVSPDIAKLSFSVVSHGANPELIVEENNKKINKAIDFVKSEGIDEKDAKTTQYNLAPRYVYDEKTRQSYISGYELTQTVLVKIRDLNKVGKILGGLPGLGINQIGQVSFEIDDPEKYLLEARDKAFEKVKSKAEEMAKKNGVRLGRVINFYEYAGPQPIPYGIGGGAGFDVMAKSTAPTIQTGTQEVIVNVNIMYEIK